MIFNTDDNPEKERNDYFEAEPQEEKPKAPKPPRIEPDDPRYYDEEESEWEHLQPRRSLKFYLWLALAGVVLGFIIAGYIRYFSPKQDDAYVYGYIELIDREGVLFHTFEGTLLPYREMMDSNRVYREDFHFSVGSDSLAARIKAVEKRGLPVRLGYRRYRGVLPWRGATPVIVTSVDSVDPRRLLPPDANPIIN